MKFSNSGVYFLQSEIGGPVKIGYSSNVTTRIRDIQSMCPFKLNLLAVIPDAGFDIEAKVHERFKDSRLHGEWFEITPLLENYILTSAHRYGE